MQKLQQARTLLKERNIKPSGYNDFTKSSYFTLADITPPIIEVSNEVRICPVFSYENERTILTIYDIDSEDSLVITSPTVETEIKLSKTGKEVSSKMQALAGNQTSQKRMLLLSTFDIVCQDDDENKGTDINNHNILEIKRRIEMEMTTLLQQGYDMKQIIDKIGVKDEKQYLSYLNALTTISKIENNIRYLINKGIENED